MYLSEPGCGGASIKRCELRRRSCELGQLKSGFTIKAAVLECGCSRVAASSDRNGGLQIAEEKDANGGTASSSGGSSFLTFLCPLLKLFGVRSALHFPRSICISTVLSKPYIYAL